jgi:hypothetical protein
MDIMTKRVSRLDVTKFFYGDDEPTAGDTDDPISALIEDTWIYRGLTVGSRLKLLDFLRTELGGIITSINVEHLYDKISVDSSKYHSFTFCCSTIDGIIVKPGPTNPRQMDNFIKKALREISNKDYSELLSLRASWAQFSCHYLLSTNHKSFKTVMNVDLVSDTLRIDDKAFHLNEGFIKFINYIREDFLHLSMPSVMIETYSGEK